jgi:uncharacterized cupin superfamily protein
MFVRIYTGPDNQSHFEDLDILPPGLETTDLQAVKGIIFARRAPGNDMDWHHAPRRQYVIGLGGETEITVGDGSSRRLGPGSVLLAEDLTGQGHTLRVVSKDDRLTASMPLD